MEVRECGVCGSWRRGDLLPSENKREDGTTPYENFVCARCQRDVREWREIERALDERRRRLQAGSVARAKGLPAS
jgi:hypothetical protein